MKTARTLWAGLVLMSLIVIGVQFTAVWLLTVGIFWGAYSAVVRKSRYWYEVWAGADVLLNAVFRGSHKEKISSRLGKAKLYNCKPVFGARWIDGLVSWWLHQIDHNHVENSVNLSFGCNCLSEDFGHNGA